LFRMFSPHVAPGDELDWQSVPSIQEYPIQSAFCVPAPGTKVKRGREGTIDVGGYAWSGGGRGIIRVEVSADGGKTWQSAELEQDPEQDHYIIAKGPMGRAYHGGARTWGRELGGSVVEVLLHGCDVTGSVPVLHYVFALLR
uniref:Mo-co_dimer domain-containing protein n=1 Tax=Heligmosomoides polygyrus TaxID=6339 RepID=A0A183GAG0_HELPZ